MAEKRKKNKIADGIFLLILALYPMRHIWLGVELTDGAYSAGNYRFPDSLGNMWLFATYLANATGSFLSKLPGGNRLMGLNFYTALFISVTAVIMYLFFTRVVKTGYLTAFLGEILAVSLCWCPTTILYNYMTYFFFHLIVAALYLGLIREKKSLMFLAGIFLGMNVLVRFPNVAEAALILSVWYYGFLQRKRMKDVLQETGICLLGFLTGAGLILLMIIAGYGLREYMDGIVRLLQMPSDASDYSLYSMVLTVLLDYKASSRWLLCMAALTALGCLVSKAGYCFVKNGKMKQGFRVFGALVFLGGIAVLFRWWHAIGVFNIKYYTYESMFQWTAVFLILTILCGASMLFSRRFTRNEKLLASMVLILIAVTPLGSNNHLYPNMNNMFLVFPFGLWMAFRFLRRLLQKGTMTEKGISLFPVGAMLSAFLLAMSFQCFLFGAVFTFRDGMNGEKRDTKIEKNVILKGMVTNQELASAVEGLTDYVNQEDLSGRSLILYGHIPATAYILDMPPAISTTWPDLRSYNYDIMVSDMERLKKVREEKERPLIILSAGVDGFLRGDTQAMEAAKLTQAEAEGYKSDKKLVLITSYMKEMGYERTFGNARFAVYQ